MSWLQTRFIWLLTVLTFLGALSGPAITTNTPGGIPPVSLPQFVLFSFDDYLTTNRYTHLQPLLQTGGTNPNGSSLRFTFFINTRRNDFWLTHQLWANGHEIATHTMSAENNDLPERPAERWRRELHGARTTLSRYAAIPIEDITGFRAPNLWYTPTTFNELYRVGYHYDATAGEYLTASGHSKRVGARIYPYELTNGIEQVPVWPAENPTNSYPGFYEVPIYPLMSNESSYVLTDHLSLTNTDEFMFALQSTFSNHYNGNRAPMTVIIHPQNMGILPARVAMYTNFIHWALGHSNTWLVTSAEAVYFVQNPQTWDQVLTNTHYATPERTALPSSSFYWAQGLTYPMRLTGNAPLVYPFWSNQYLRTQTITAPAQSAYRYTASSGSNIYQDLVAYSLVISNSAPWTTTSWCVSYSLRDATNRAFYGASWTYHHSNEHWSAKPEAYSAHISPGQVNTNVHIMVRLTNNLAPAVFENMTVDLYGDSLEYTPPSLLSSTISNAHDLHLTWQEAGYEYRIDSTTNLTGSWQAVTDIVFGTATQLPVPTNRMFYRITATP